MLWPDAPHKAHVYGDEKGVHIAAMVDGQVVGCVSVFVDLKAKEAQVRKFAVAPEFRKQGVGTVLLHHAVSRAARAARATFHHSWYTEKATPFRIFLNARYASLAWYEERGFRLAAAPPPGEAMKTAPPPAFPDADPRLVFYRGADIPYATMELEFDASAPPFVVGAGFGRTGTMSLKFALDSARIERFLQMVDEDPRLMPRMDEENWFTGGHLGGQIQRCNWQIVNVTTPANYFHVLRRQMHRDFRKPLIVFSPKSLLRHPKCVSPLTDFDDLDDPNELQGPRFRRLIMDDASLDKGPDPEPKLGHVERLVFCSGKVYYDLIALRDEKIAGSGDPRACSVAICRIEQLSPFPFDLVRRELRRYPNAEVVFCQEEPLNMGPYWYSVPRINTCLEAVLGAPGASKESIAAREAGVQYAGRPPSASPATGFAKVHVREQSELCHEALGLPSSAAGARS